VHPVEVLVGVIAHGCFALRTGKIKFTCGGD
jgi:hypothetical protein